jgi:VWFA-related protein
MSILPSSLLMPLLMLPLVALKAQTPLRPHPKQDREVSLNVVVTAKDGATVSGLTQQDFVLKDNNSSPAIKHFEAVTANTSPAEAILVIDAVNLNFVRLADERIRIERFLKRNEILPVPTALAFFTDHGLQLQQGYSTNGKELSDTLDHYVTGFRTTRRSAQHEEQDRFNLSMAAMTELIAHEGLRPGRKLVFWVSPGWPLLTGPAINLDLRQQDGLFRDVVGFATEMLEAHMTLYSLNPLGSDEATERAFYYQNFLKGVVKPSQVQIGDLSLQVLAVQSGGLVLNSTNDLENELKACFADAKASYNLSFDEAPGESENDYHHLAVVVERPGLKVRTKDVYYAQP